MVNAELVQWFADTSRLLKIGLRTHDVEIVDSVYLRIAERYGQEIAEKSVYQMITHIIETEGWEWEDAEGNPSPLLDHDLPGDII